MDKLDKELSKIFKREVIVPVKFEQTIKNALNNEKKCKNTNIDCFMKIVATFIITCACGIGAVSAGVSTYNYFTKSSYQKVNVRPGDNPEIDAEYGIIKSDESNGIYYKKISTYDDYKRCKEIWTDLYDMNDSDFENYFLVMISLSKESKLPYYISNINSDETTLYIEISQSEDEITYDNHKTFFSTKIEKKYEREKIEIREVLIVPNVDINQYTDIKKIAEGENYAVEKAISEGCFVTNEKNEIISNNENIISDFVKNTKAGKEGHIRIVQYSEDMQTVRDVEYRGGKYYTALYMQWKVLNEVEITLTYNRFDKLTEHYVTVDKINWVHEVWGEDNEENTMIEGIVAYK